MPPKRWRIDGNFVASPGEFWLQENPTVQRAHCAMWCHLRMRDDRKMLIVKEKLNLTSISCHIPARVRCSDRQSAIEALLPESFFMIRWKFFTCFKPAISAFTTSTFWAAEKKAMSRSPLSDIFFEGPHDITRYLGFWYDYHTILTIF